MYTGRLTVKTNLNNACNLALGIANVLMSSAAVALPPWYGAVTETIGVIEVSDATNYRV
jgi:hypothetical protein